jgi:hypothetical protein
MRVKPGDLPTTVAFRISPIHLQKALDIADDMEVSLSQVLRKLVSTGLAQMQRGKTAA